MVYRPRGKRVYYGKLPMRAGWKNLCLRTQDADTARAIQRMLDGFRHQRRWEYLDLLAEKRVSIGRLYDAHQRGALAALLAHADDADLSTLIPGWQKRIAGRVSDQTRLDYLAKVRWLIPPGTAYPQSRATTVNLTGWLDVLPVGDDTKRRYHAAASSFFGYCVLVKALPSNPMREFSPPKAGKPRLRWLSQADMGRVVRASAEPFRSLFALLYGTGIEVTVACHLTRRAVNLSTREIFAPGTKTHCRERTIRVSEWAWAYIATLCEGKLPDAELFPGMRRHRIAYQHAQTCKRLGLVGYQPRDSRHSWAVRAAKAGTPAEIIARQLGHVNAVMVFRVYGRFMPDQHDRDKWERIATLQNEPRATPAATSPKSGVMSQRVRP